MSFEMCASENLWPIYLKMMTTHLDICYRSSKTNEILSALIFNLSVHLISLRSFVNVRYDG